MRRSARSLVQGARSWVDARLSSSVDQECVAACISAVVSGASSADTARPRYLSSATTTVDSWQLKVSTRQGRLVVGKMQRVLGAFARPFVCQAALLRRGCQVARRSARACTCFCTCSAHQTLKSVLRTGQRCSLAVLPESPPKLSHPSLTTGSSALRPA